MSLTSLLRLSRGSVAAVVAHPDDETFGLGALLANLASEGCEVRVLCFTHGEASTIGAEEGLAELRRRELMSATAVLGVADVRLLDLPDGGLDAVADSELDACIEQWLTFDVAGFVVFERRGVTGHPDHQAVSRAAIRVAARRALPVVEWGIDPLSASRLEAEHGLTFETISDGPGVHDVRVDRTAQLAAIGHHASQLDDDPVVCRVLALLGDSERVRIGRPRDVA